MPPCSEALGRHNPYLYSTAVYSIACLIVGVVPHVAGVFIGRFFSGFASAVPSVVLAGSIEDLFGDESRLWWILVWNSFTTLGLTVGPIYGSFIAASIGWRWIYYTAAMVTAGILAILFATKESRPSKRLETKIEQLRKVNITDLEAAESPDSIKDTRELLRVIFWRPIQLGCTEPIIILVSLMNATAWGLVYLFTESLTVVYGQYGWSSTTSSLTFVAIAIGVPFSILPRFWDLHVLHSKKQQNKKVEPEDKIIGFAIAAPCLAMGLWLFSWTIPPYVHIHWIVSLLGLVLVGFAANEFAYTLNAYLSDSYTVYASSSLAALAFLRGIVSGVMPLFAHQMFTGLGSNIAGSIIAGVATLFCVMPFIFFRYGKRMREKSRFARKSVEMNEKFGDD
ncbi:MFS general substrate transporter [Aureobasidium sp. EXF-3400]|nr:MFS general substrate transporter [Aureobasidium sp. EXF-12344]KAI4775713.1 MFS general substrate transporter [Aureobasidium sp. EXF-3400]